MAPVCTNCCGNTAGVRGEARWKPEFSPDCNWELLKEARINLEAACCV